MMQTSRHACGGSPAAGREQQVSLVGVTPRYSLDYESATFGPVLRRLVTGDAVSAPAQAFLRALVLETGCALDAGPLELARLIALASCAPDVLDRDAVERFRRAGYYELHPAHLLRYAAELLAVLAAPERS